MCVYVCVCVCVYESHSIDEEIFLKYNNIFLYFFVNVNCALVGISLKQKLF